MTLGRTRRRLLAAGAVLVTLGVTGCTDGGNATPTPTASAVTPSAEATPSATPTMAAPSAPQPPTAMSARDIAGAEAAAMYAIAVLNHASATGDVTEWNRITSPNCETCQRFAGDITTAGADPGGAVEVTSSKPTEVDPGAFYTVALVVSQAPYTRPDGSANDGGTFALLLALRFSDAWVIEAIDVGEADAPWVG